MTNLKMTEKLLLTAEQKCIELGGQVMNLRNVTENMRKEIKRLTLHNERLCNAIDGYKNYELIEKNVELQKDLYELNKKLAEKSHRINELESILK